MSAVHEAILGVMQDVQSLGKGQRNTSPGGGYMFRGIDDVMNAVGPNLRKHKVFVVPKVVSFEYGEVHVGKNRTPMGHARVVAEFTWHGADGSTVVMGAPGEAMDSGDKATAKAMSVAFRTALLQSLCLPTHEQDADASTYERAPAGQTEATPAPVTDMDWFQRMVVKISEATDLPGLKGIWSEMVVVDRKGDLEPAHRDEIVELWGRRKDEIKQDLGTPATTPIEEEVSA